jgi:hypothetical protein
MVACGGGERGGGSGEGSVQRRRAALLRRDGTLSGEMKRYIKDISGHKFAERGGGVLQIYVFMTDIHIIGL